MSQLTLKLRSFFSHRIPLIGLLLFSTLGCDQVTKEIAIDTLKGEFPRSFLGNLFRLEYMENTGAFLGFGSDFPEEIRFWFFVALVGVFLFGLFLFLIFKPHLDQGLTISLSLILGGGVSNLYDRIFRPDGGVVDFMNVGIGSLRTGIFNFADMFIMAGTLLLLYLVFTQEEEEEAETQSAKLKSNVFASK